MRDVLVELDLYAPAGSRWISCSASHAPYAAAGRTPWSALLSAAELTALVTRDHRLAAAAGAAGLSAVAPPGALRP